MSRPDILDIVGKPHPFWTQVLYGQHQKVLDRDNEFRHTEDDLTRWLIKLELPLCRFWCFSSLLQDSNFCWHILNCLEDFYKHGMHVSIIDCINIMMDAFIVYESGHDEYDRDSDDNSVFEHRTLCFMKQQIPFAALCMFLDNPFHYHFISSDFKFVLIRRIRSCFRRTDRPGVFSSLSFNSRGVPSYHESGGISLIQILRPSGRINYPIESVFHKNPQYKKFGEVFKSLISSEPFMRPELFFQRAFRFLPDKNSRHVLHTLQTILQTQCKDVSFSQSELSSILIECLNAHPNLKSVVGFTGFLFQTFLRTREQSLQLRIAWRPPIKMHLQVGCNQIPFDARFVRKIKMIGFLNVLLSSSERISRNQLYSIIRRVLSNLLL